MTDQQKKRDVDENRTSTMEDGPTGANGAATDVDGATAEQPPLDVDAVIAERDQYLDQLQRSVAEFANYRRRIDQEREQVREIANRFLLAQIVPVLDDLQRALGSVPPEQQETAWTQGIAHIERKLAGVLERAGVTAIEAIGQPFDPALHEAVATDPGSAGSTVVEIYQPGYRLGQSLLRPAMVKVGDEIAQ